MSPLTPCSKKALFETSLKVYILWSKITFLSVNRLYNVNEGTPHKRGIMVENAFEMERMEQLRELLKGD